jgi:transposase InsO family protein
MVLLAENSLAIVWALQRFRDWLSGTHFVVETDHMALTYLFTQKQFNYMMLNWIDVLLDYDFEVVHCPGITHVLPDALSRIYTEFRRERGGERAQSTIRALVKISELPSFPEKQLSKYINEVFLKVTVPAPERQAKLHAAHSKGHFGADSLFQELWDSGVYWPFMKRDCQSLVATCLVCLRFNIGKRGYHPQKCINAELPFEHVALDTITGFPTTSRGNNCILVIVDLLTRFKVIYAQPSKSARDTAWSFWQCVCLFPLPKIIQSDRGTEFVNQVVAELKNLLGVQHRLIAGYNPRANGTAENAVGNTQVILKKISNGNLEDWDLRIPAVNLAINTHTNVTNGTSPSNLLFAVGNHSFANYDRAQSRLLTMDQLAQRANVIQDLVRPNAQKLFSKRRETRAAAVNAHKIITSPIPVGTQVMVFDPTRSSKHQPYWFGPFVVVRQNRGGTYVLQDTDLSLFPREPPRDQLKVIDGYVPAGDIHTVEAIIHHRGTPSNRSFLIKWQGYPKSENSWEPEANLLTCQELLVRYWSRCRQDEAEPPLQAVPSPARMPAPSAAPPVAAVQVNAVSAPTVSTRAGRSVSKPSKYN